MLEKTAWSKLLTCDVIVAATDNHTSRMLLNTLSAQYLIPQVWVGSLIELDGTTISRLAVTCVLCCRAEATMLDVFEKNRPRRGLL